MMLNFLMWIIFWLFCYLLGYIPYRLLFKTSNNLERIVVPQVFGLILMPALFFIFSSLIGFYYSIIIVPILIVIGIILSLKKHQKIEKVSTGKLIYLLLCIFCLLIIISILPNSMYTASADPMFYQTATNHIKNIQTFPPEMGCFAGYVYHYPWFFNLLMALQEIYSGLPIFVAYPIYIVYSMLLFISAAFMLGLKYSNNKLLSTFFAFILAAFFYSSFQVANPPNQVLPIVLIFIYYLLDFLKKKSFRSGIISGAIAGSMIYIHGLSFGFSVLVILAFCVRKLLDFKKESLLNILYIISGFVVSIPYIAIIKGQALSAFLVLPFATLISFNYLKEFSFFILIFVGSIVIGNNSKEPKRTLIYSIIFVFIFVNIFVMRDSTNIERFMIYTVFPIGLLGLDFIQKLNKKATALIFIIALIIFIPYVGIQTFAFYKVKPTVETDEYLVSKWLKENTDIKDIIITAPIPSYAGLSERREIICEPFFLIPWLYNSKDVKLRFGELLSLYKEPSKKLIDKYGAKYFIFGANEKSFLNEYGILPFSFETSDAFKPVYKTEKSTIYELINTTRLVEYAELPAFDSYSRWWTVIE